MTTRAATANPRAASRSAPSRTSIAPNSSAVVAASESASPSSPPSACPSAATGTWTSTSPTASSGRPAPARDEEQRERHRRSRPRRRPRASRRRSGGRARLPRRRRSPGRARWSRSTRPRARRARSTRRTAASEIQEAETTCRATPAASRPARVSGTDVTSADRRRRDGDDGRHDQVREPEARHRADALPRGERERRHVDRLQRERQRDTAAELGEAPARRGAGRTCARARHRLASRAREQAAQPGRRARSRRSAPSPRRARRCRRRRPASRMKDEPDDAAEREPERRRVA